MAVAYACLVDACDADGLEAEGKYLSSSISRY